MQTSTEEMMRRLAACICCTRAASARALHLLEQPSGVRCGRIKRRTLTDRTAPQPPREPVICHPVTMKPGWQSSGNGLNSPNHNHHDACGHTHVLVVACKSAHGRQRMAARARSRGDMHAGIERMVGSLLQGCRAAPSAFCALCAETQTAAAPPGTPRGPRLRRVWLPALSRAGRCHRCALRCR